MTTLDSLTAAKLLGHASTGAADPAAEAMRKIEVKGNDAFWDPQLVAFWTAWDDTAHTDSLYTPVFMNDETAAMFSNTSAYPNLVQSGNISTDPQYGYVVTTAVNNPDGIVGDGSGFAPWIGLVRNGSGTTQFYAVNRTEVPQPEPINYVPTWPVPEATALHSSLGLAPDGTVYGDPRWANVTAVNPAPPTVPAKFDLSNNYPNPFNPSTTINFTVAQNGPTNLKIYNTLGQLVMTVFDGNAVSHQNYAFNISMDRFASGIYFYTLHNAGNSITKKMVLLK